EVYVCEPVHNLVMRAQLIPNGASYRAERRPDEVDSEFLASSDAWFRPVRVTGGPDGAMWVVDMYRQTIEHPEWIPDAWQAKVDLKAGQYRGRIYRIIPSGTQLPLPANLAAASDDDLINVLKSPIGPLRDVAQQQLIQRGTISKEQIQPLAGTDMPAVTRVHALALLDQLQRLDEATLDDALRSEHVGLVRFALDLIDRGDSAEPIWRAVFKELADQRDLGVLARLSTVLGRHESEDAGRLLAKIAQRDDLDSWTRTAIVAAAGNHDRFLFRQMLQQLVGEPRPNDANRTDVNPLLKSLMHSVARAGGDVTIDLGEVLKNQDLPLATRLLLASWMPRGKSHDSQPGSELSGIYQDAVKLMRNDRASELDRCRAINLVGIGLGSSDEELQWLIDLLDPTVPVSVQSAAVDRLAQMGEKAVDRVFEVWDQLTATVRDQCVQSVLTHLPWNPVLLDAIESQRVGVNDLTAAARQQIRESGTRAMKVRSARLIVDTSPKEKAELIERYLAAFNETADPQAGQQVYKAKCAVCHQSDTRGLAVGASLDNVTDRRDRSWVESILDPNRAVDPQYQNQLIETNDGRVLSGAIAAEAGGSVTLAHADGKRTTIDRANIASMRNTGRSLMPEGFESQITPAQMQDLVTYLQQQPWQQSSHSP
ncbi:MAG: c-type cytochrome, partial [Planctomycetota bacterium]